MNIGVAKPSEDTLLLAPHHLINIIKPYETYSVAQFVQDALKQIDEILLRGHIPFLVGGTMMYFNALEKGVHQMPATNYEIRKKVAFEAKTFGWASLHEKLKEIDVIEVFALAYMRGMNIDNSILIFEEAQNSTPNQMKLLLTRIGFNSKFFISGDLEQTDRYKDKTHSGLWDAINKFKDMDEIGVFEFTQEDIVRNPLITKILKRYEE